MISDHSRYSVFNTAKFVLARSLKGLCLPYGTMEVLHKGLRLYICHQNLPIVVHSVFTFIMACCISVAKKWLVYIINQMCMFVFKQ